VVFPTTAGHVSNAIKFAIAHSIPFTACGGGHSTSGSSASDGGLVIDLRRMRDASVDPEARTITFGGGCLWSDVDDAAWIHGLSTPGGGVSHTGVGGLILGGGFGFLSARDGLTIDCLLSVEVVLADGTITTASDAENPDLFWALRGAGQGFGIATSFTSRVFPQGNVWAGSIVFPVSRIADVVAGANAVLEAEKRDRAVVVGLAFVPMPEPTPALVVLAFFDGPQDAGEKAFAPLLSLGPLASTAQEVAYPAVNTLANPMFPHGGRYQFGGANATYPLSAAVVQATADAWFDGLNALNSADDLRGSAVMFEGIPSTKIREVAPEATAFASRGSYFNVALIMNWKNAASDAAVMEFRRKIAAQIRSMGFEGDEVGGKGVGHYYNYLSSRVSAEAAFGGNAARLKELKAKYDPDNRFDKLWK